MSLVVSVTCSLHLLLCAGYLPLLSVDANSMALLVPIYVHTVDLSKGFIRTSVRSQAAGDPGKYQNTDWASAFTSQLHEYDYWVTDVEGVVPDTLRGTLFRNGPGRFEHLSSHSHVLCFHPCFDPDL